MRYDPQLWSGNIQAAIDQAAAQGGGEVIIDRHYLIETPLVLPSGVNLIGAGVTNAIIEKSGNGLGVGTRLARVPDNYAVDSIISIDHADNDTARNIVIRGVNLRGCGNAYGLYMPRAGYVTLDNVWMSNVEHGIYGYEIFQQDWNGVTVRDCGYGFQVADDGSGSGGSTTISMTRCYANRAAVRGFSLFGTHGSSLTGCAADHVGADNADGIGIPGTAYRFDYCRGITIVGGGAELVTGSIVIARYTSIVVNGMYTYKPSGITTGTWAALRFDGASATLNGCKFAPYDIARGNFNLIVQSASNVRATCTTLPEGGNPWLSLSDNSTLVTE